MATLLLTAIGTAVAGSFGPVTGALIQAGAGLAGAAIDQALFGTTTHRELGRLTDLDVQSSSEGAPIPRVFGRVRIAGQLIWATRFEEVGQTTSSGGKGFGRRSSVTTYSYFANVAIGLCEGPVARIGRVWANGDLLDLSTVTLRVHTGEETQEPDALLAARQGDVPAYRGLAYVVFERLPLAAFGNTIPQLTFEVIRPVGRLERMIRAVTLIPAATEFGYATTAVQSVAGEGITRAENRHVPVAATDAEAALDELQALCPNLRSVALVATWFGDDLRAGDCEIRPRVEFRAKTTTGQTWSVAGLDRAAALEVSRFEGRPATGGTPSDASLVEMVRALKARGLEVVFYPFLLMDVPAGNGLPDPQGGAEQPAYPWRGRITGHPAPGMPGSPDGTPAAAGAVAAFLGAASRAHYSLSGGAVVYSGPEDWGYRRMILHYAALMQAAGGVDGFLIGSELRGLTTLRGPGGTYPFVEGLRALAADVRAMLGPETEIGYAADWTEWFGHQPGGGDVAFHLDPLWADPNIDYVGIDAYFPLSDWRAEDSPDAALADGPHDRSRLLANVAGGEGFDWYYASEADRRDGIRTPITDGAAGKPWVFRFKDLAGWWGNRHHPRIAGVEQAVPTAWLPGMKPIRFTEIGCPAVEFGANEPNVFPDRISSEGRPPRFSRGGRDDAMQRRAVEAMLRRFDPSDPDFEEHFNPVSPVDGRRMLDHGASHVWTFDARPFPWFPLAGDVWTDGRNWATGHWLNGRLGAAPLDDLLPLLTAGLGVTVDAEGLSTVVDGLIVGDRASARAVIEPLARLYRFSVAETATGLRLSDRATRIALAAARDDLATDGRTPLIEIRRGQAEDLPGELSVGFLDLEAENRQASVTARRIGPPRVLDLALPVTAAPAVMQAVAEALLRDLEAGRETVEFALPPQSLALEPGDLVRLDTGDRVMDLLVERIEDGDLRRVRARSVDRTAPLPPAGGTDTRIAASLPAVGPPLVELLDVPGGEDADAFQPLIAASADPWPGTLAVHRRAGSGFEPLVTLPRPATMGRLLGSLPAGRLWLVDERNRVEVELVRGALAAVDGPTLLDGGNLAAVGDAATGWEVIQFRDAELVGERRYRLSGFLRGQAGSEARTLAGHPAGSRFVLLDAAVARLPVGRAQLGRPVELRIGPADRDVGDAAMTALTATPAGAGLTPYAPVRLTARRLPGGDVDLSWIRRTRIGGDDFDAREVPLGETAEIYELTIHAGGVPVRTLRTGAPRHLYTAAEQTADFGAPPASLDVSVRQLADGDRPGHLTRRILHV